MSTSIENQRALFVLGMHRSGTSALARILNLMGVDLGIDSEASGKDNQWGFWKNPDLVTINEDILKSMHSSWQDFRSLPENWWQSETWPRSCAGLTPSSIRCSGKVPSRT